MRKLVRLTSVLVAVSLLTILCAIPASAAEMSGTATYYTGTYISSFQLSSSGYSVNYSSMSEQKISITFARGGKFGLGSLDIGDDSTFYTGSVGVYVSYFYQSGGAVFSLIASPGNPSTRYKNHLGLDGSGDHDVKVVSFTPSGVTPGSSYTYGYTLSATFLCSDENPITELRIVGDSNSLVGSTTGSGLASAYIYFPSLRVVATETSADLEALESIADGIAAQNDILQAMYGDIIAICNAIYAKTGDMVTAQELTNSYFASIIPVLNDIKDLNSSIYSLLGTQFAALISAVQTESSNIQAAISAQTAALIAYFESVQNVSSVPDVIQDKTQQGETIRNDMAGLNKPDLTAPDPSDFFTDEEAAPFTDVLGQLFSSSLIVNLLLVAFSIAFVAYVLYGKE